MRAVIQRVSSASVSVDHEAVGSIGRGFLVLLGICEEDTQEDVVWLTRKIAAMRVFSDENGLMNLSLADVSGSVLLVSQFTLYASTRKGNRPSFIRSARPEKAQPLYELFGRKLSDAGVPDVAFGIFGADMKVALVNDGPVTIIIDSQNKE